MANQDGIFKIKGTLGGVTFYKTKDGHLVREKGGIDKKRMAKDPAFKRTRENGSEFGRAGTYGKYLRSAFRPMLNNTSDKRVVSRLVKQLMALIKTDTVNARGERTPVAGDFEMLRGFDFNSNGLLGNTLYVPYNATIDRASGAVSLELPELVPEQMISAPAGTTHFKIVTGASEVDFQAGNSLTVYTGTAEIPWDNTPMAALALDLALTPASTLPLVLLLGVEFYQEINGVFYMLNNGSFNALAIVNLNKQ
ncbi:hypothetical protein EG242_13615 [Paenimyroides viscosum]|uniref:Uncharacterized protein n=2 Tax=Paenimyroides viscosum TaxID=2488729 RepID=A0A3P1ARA3_9FLAO|nr:hypothetical protein EG242_13615 [Paenimyroides viscosum]